MTNCSKDQNMQGSHKNLQYHNLIINIVFLQFSFLTPDWLFSCSTLTFQKYFWCSWFCQFHCYIIIIIYQSGGDWHLIFTEL